MKSKPVFSSYHPAVSFVYALFIIISVTAVMNPVLIAVSLICALICGADSGGRKKAFRLIKNAVAVFIFPLIINPLFSHAGQTVLMYFPSGNPLTLESILYGLTGGIMLSSLITWFSFFSLIIDSDKIIYYFGRLSPSLSLLLSMTVRFIPLFKARYREIRDANFTLYDSSNEKKLRRRFENAVLCIRTAAIWTAEQGAEISDSMKSRGYGTGKRRTYSPYIFEGRDRRALIFFGICIFVFICGCFSGCMSFGFYPRLKFAKPGITGFFVLTACTVLYVFPVFAQKEEEKAWKNL